MTMWAMGWFSANIRRDTERRRRHFWTEKVNQEVNEGIPPAAISDSVAFLAVQVEPVVHFVHHLVVVSIFHWHFRPRWSWLQAKEPNRTASGVRRGNPMAMNWNSPTAAFPGLPETVGSYISPLPVQSPRLWVFFFLKTFRVIFRWKSGLKRKLRFRIGVSWKAT